MPFFFAITPLVSPSPVHKEPKALGVSLGAERAPALSDSGFPPAPPQPPLRPMVSPHLTCPVKVEQNPPAVGRHGQAGPWPKAP